MKVLLISANTLNTPYPVYPMGLDYVAAALVDKHQVTIADMNLTDMEALEQIIKNFKPQAIGISLRNIDNTDTSDPQGFIHGYKKLVTAIRRLTKAVIILGGSGFSIFPDKIIAALAADYGIVGEGERMASVLDALEKDQIPQALPGVVIPGREIPKPVPLTESWRRHFDIESKHLPYYLHKGGMLNLQTKRGCPFRCIYCTYPHIEGRGLRLIPPKQVAHTARQLQEAGAKYLFIADSAFNADSAHSLEVAEQFREAGVSIPWGAFMAPLKMPDNYYDILATAGMAHAEFGTESLSNRVLKAYGKPFDRQQIFRSHEASIKAGLHVAHYFLLGGPGETVDTLNMTLTNIDNLKKSVLFLFCGIRIYPHTALFDRALAEGQITRSQDLLEPVFYQSQAIGAEEIIQRVKAESRGRINWVIGAGDEETSQLVTRMYDKGYTGPLWEYLVR